MEVSAPGPGLVDELACAMPALDERQQRTAIALYGLLAEGRPVSRVRLAEHASTDLTEVSRLVDEQPGVFLDGAGEVIGFWGMALADTPHRMRIDGRVVRAWCAWDTLFLPELIGKQVAVESPCPVTGETVRLRVSADGVRDPSPRDAVLSFLRPNRLFDASTITTFCHFVHFFASSEAAERWTAEHAGTFVLSIDDGFQLGRRVNRAKFGAALGRTAAAGSAK
jgi:alkylmercury lyase